MSKDMIEKFEVVDGIATQIEKQPLMDGNKVVGTKEVKLVYELDKEMLADTINNLKQALKVDQESLKTLQGQVTDEELSPELAEFNKKLSAVMKWQNYMKKAKFSLKETEKKVAYNKRLIQLQEEALQKWK